MQMLKRIDETLANVLKIFVTSLGVGIAVILFVRVIVRFTPLLISLSWTDEVVEWMMAWMIFTCATLIMREKGHFAVDLLQTKFAGKQWLKMLNLVIVIIEIIFFAALFYYSAELVRSTKQFSPILKVSTKFPYLSIPVNCALMLVYLCRDLIVDAKAVFKR